MPDGPHGPGGHSHFCLGIASRSSVCRRPLIRRGGLRRIPGKLFYVNPSHEPTQIVWKRRVTSWLGWLFLAVLILGVAAGMFPAIPWWVVGTVQGEAFFQNRPTSYWEHQLHSDPSQQWEAHQALVSGRERAVPVLVQMLQRKDRACWTVVTDTLYDTTAAKSAQPELLDIIRDPDNPNREMVWLMMKKVDPPAADEAMFGNSQ